MARFFVAAVDNPLITSGAVTGADRAKLKRVGDPIEILGDGVSGGLKIEDTVPHDEWRHPVTNEPMTVNPKFWIIEGTPIPKNDPAITEFKDPELGPGPSFSLIQKHKYQFVRSGVAPNTLTPAELTILEATHRLSLNRGRTLQVFNLRPAPS